VSGETPHEATRHRWGRWRLPTWATVILWIPTVAMAVVALMRIVAWDDLELFAVLNCVTLVIYLPAWFVAPVAALGRRFVLAGAALLIMVAQVAFLYPELSAAEPVPSWAAHAPSFRLLDANVYSGNPSMAGYARQIAQVSPDLVTLEEANPPDVRQLLASGVLATLPHRVEVDRYDPFAFFVACRYPLWGTHVVSLFGRPLIVQTTIALPSGPLTLWVVHAIAPLPVSFDQWKQQLASIDRALRSRGPSRIIVVGDFNATWGTKGFRAILDDGVVDAAAARGSVLSMTWSQTKPIVPPLVRIDHVLTSLGVTATQIRTDEGPGSDHRDLIATIAVRRR
jgi:endonuclease/exonuclease/phosphatase (EEP) superfamily protein YafD